MIENWKKYADNGKLFTALLTDLSKVFDKDTMTNILHFMNYSVKGWVSFNT